MVRAGDPELRKRIREVIRRFPDQRIDQGKDHNKGGLSNILEKSLGYYFKEGTVPVSAVTDFAVPV